MLDLVVAGGTLADGSGAQPRAADIGVQGDRIAVIAAPGALTGAARLDATGLLVAPGFIDIHSHSDFTLLADPRAQSQVFQGVTTEVVGNCGHGCAPLTDVERFTGNIYGWRPEPPVSWRSFAGYLEALEKAKTAVNVAGLVPNGNLRLAAVAETSQAAGPKEISRMTSMLEECLEAGAWGFSTGLEYPAERAARAAEIEALCRVVAKHGGLYAAHTRNREVRAAEAVQEAVQTAGQSRVRLQVSHIIPRRGGHADSLRRCIEAVEEARARGLDVAFDSHTRMHGITNLSNALPTWALEGGPEAIRARLAGPAVRARLRQHESIISSFALGGWDRVRLYSSPASPELAGKTFADLSSLPLRERVGEGGRTSPASSSLPLRERARERGRTSPVSGDPWDAVYDVLSLHADDVHAPLCICLSYDEPEVMATMAHPLCTVGSDATALGVDGPLAGQTFMGAFTWAGWFWRRMVVESKLLSVGEAVKKLTAAPAGRLGLKGRGRVAQGAAADIVVFNPHSFRETGTLEEPNSLATGMRHVVVNGVVTLQEGRETGSRGGRVLRPGRGNK